MVTDCLRPDGKYEENGADPAWVGGLLQFCAEQTYASASSGFLERCQEAADAAKTMRSLRESAGRIGFEPLAFSQYVERVAFGAGVALGSVLRFLGISPSGDTSQLDDAGPGAVRLAVGLGVPLRELLVHLRLGGLVRAGLPGIRFARLRGEGETRGDFVSAIEEELGELEARVRPSLGEEYGTLEDRVRRIYGTYLSSG